MGDGRVDIKRQKQNENVNMDQQIESKTKNQKKALDYHVHIHTSTVDGSRRYSITKTRSCKFTSKVKMRKHFDAKTFRIRTACFLHFLKNIIAHLSFNHCRFNIPRYCTNYFDSYNILMFAVFASEDFAKGTFAHFRQNRVYKVNNRCRLAEWKGNQ